MERYVGERKSGTLPVIMFFYGISTWAHVCSGMFVCMFLCEMSMRFSVSICIFIFIV